MSNAILFAKDGDCLSRFYSQVASLEIEQSEVGYVLLNAKQGISPFELIVHSIPCQIAEQIEITSPPLLREECAIKLAFEVADLAEARRVAKQLGGELQPTSKEWEFRGMKICDGYDPEGNIFQLRERLAGKP